MLDDSTGATGVQMAVNLETNFPESTIENNNGKCVVNNIQVHLCYVCSFFHFDLIPHVNFTIKFIN
jgi:hypothetical protein